MAPASRSGLAGRFIVGLVFASLLCAGGANLAAAGKPVGVSLAPLQDLAARSMDRLKVPDVSGAQAVFKSFEDIWSPMEDSVRAADPGIYARIEVAATRAEAAMDTSPPDVARALQAMAALSEAAGQFGQAAPTAASPSAAGVESLTTLLAQVRDSLATGRFDQASDLMEAFLGLWPVVETQVKGRSPELYDRLESEMTRASSLVFTGASARPAAMDQLATMLGQLERLQEPTGYSAWDAGIILLREGMEALLVLAALLAMLRKRAANAAPLWVWAGAGSGLILSAGLAVLLGSLVTVAGAAMTREVLEGIVGLASVFLMVTVGAWLHRRSNLKAWNGYVESRASRAMAAGATWSLYSLSLLVVLREGAETVILLIGIEAGIGLAQMLLGVGVALAALVLVGFLLIRFSARLPLHWFFLAATVLIYYLAFKIAGESIHALQVAGVIPSHYAGRLPALGPLGMSPTWETFLLQAVILVLVLAEVVSTEARRFSARRKSAS